MAMYSRHNTTKEFINKVNLQISVSVNNRKYIDRYLHTSLFKHPSLKTTKLKTLAVQTLNKTFSEDKPDFPVAPPKKSRNELLFSETIKKLS